MRKIISKDSLYTWSAFLIPFALYIITMPSVVTLEDSGLFLVNGFKLGIAHPPGYPLYTLLSHLATLFPLGSVAAKIHFLSALFSATTCFLVFLISRFYMRPLWALTAVLALCFNRIFWGQSIIAEVYALNTLITITILYCLLRYRRETYREDKRDNSKEKISKEKNSKEENSKEENSREKSNGEDATKWIYSAAAVYGFGLANHWPLLGLATIGLIILLPKNFFKKTKTLLVSIGLACSGLLWYLYLPIRSMQKAEFTFVGDVTTFSQLLDYFLRRYYSNVDSQLAHTWVEGFKFFGYFLFEVISGNLFWVVPFIVLGMISLAQKNKKETLGLSFVMISVPCLLHFVFFAEYTSLNINVYRVWLMVPMVIVFIFFGVGLEWVSERFKPNSKYLVVVVGLGLISLFVQGNRLSNLSQDTFAYDYAKMTLESLPFEATLFVRGDTDVGPIAYVQNAEGIRPDVKIYNQSGHFFANRLFDPRESKNYEKLNLTKDFVASQSRIFSTKRLDIFVRQKNLPYKFHYNGLYYEVMPLGVAETPEEPELSHKILSFVEKYGISQENYHWQFHRDVILAQLCNYMILKGHENHRVFDEVEACWPIKARHLKRYKRYEESQKYFDRILTNFKRPSLGDRLTIMYDSLENYVGMLNQTTPSSVTKANMIDKKIEGWLPTVFRYKKCDNHVVGGLLKLRTQLNIKLPLEELSIHFGRCKKFKPLFSAIR